MARKRGFLVALPLLPSWQRLSVFLFVGYPGQAFPPFVRPLNLI